MTLVSFIRKFIRNQKWIFGLILVLSCVWTFENLFWPFFIGKLVDILTGHDKDRLSAWPILQTFLLGGAFLWLSMETVFRIRDYLEALAYPKLEESIRLTMFDHVQKHSPKYFQSHFAGSLANKVADMVLAVSSIMRSLLTLFIPMLITCLVTVLIFAQIHTLLAFVVGIWIILHFFLCWILTVRCTAYSHIHGEARSVLGGKIVDSFTNNFVVNLFYRFRFEKELIAREQKKERDTNEKAQIYTVKTWAVLCFTLAIEIFTLIGFTISYWLHDKLSTGQVVQVIYTIWNVSFVLLLIANKSAELFQSLGIAKQALSIMNDPQDIIDHPHAVNLIVGKGEIVFDNVSFQYGEKSIFRNKSLRIASEEKVGLVGYSGAGKSTFVNLILRFFPLDKGRILIDGQDIALCTLESLRTQIALIPQDPTLFHRSLEENIHYGCIEASQDEVIQASKRAHCDDFIKACPEGYDTLVGERGVKLSGGERQRIAIARAMLLKAPILILDEATSALDSVTESYIQDSLENLMSTRTTIIIAHRLSTLSKMDRILVFDQGKIVEEGSHQDLLKKGGHYAYMWQMQAGGFLPEFKGKHG